MKSLKMLPAALMMAAMPFAVQADPAQDEAMLKLATASGCLTCHGVKEPRPGPGGIAPIAPSWADVAKQYAGKPGAADFLTKVVMEGSNPYGSVWQGKISGLAMPPNAVAITETDARSLVYWILAMKP